MAARVCHTPRGSVELTYGEVFILWFMMHQRNTLVTPGQIRSLIGETVYSDAQIKILIDALNVRLMPVRQGRHNGLIMSIPRTGYMIFDGNPLDQ